MEDMGLLLELAEEVAQLSARVAVLESDTGQAKGTSRFTPPTLEEVRECMIAYCIQEGYRTDVSPREFMDFYESNGWKIGPNKMKSWAATARNWCRRNRIVENKKGTEAYHRHGL